MLDTVTSSDIHNTKSDNNVKLHNNNNELQIKHVIVNNYDIPYINVIDPVTGGAPLLTVILPLIQSTLQQQSQYTGQLYTTEPHNTFY